MYTLIRADISVRTPAAILLWINRRQEALIRIYDFFHETENDLSQISEILFELGVKK